MYKHQNIAGVHQRCRQWMQRHPMRSAAWLFYHPSSAHTTKWIRSLMHHDICLASVDHGPCGVCVRCHWYQENAHPDVHHVGLNDTQSLIGIEAIRQLQARLSRKSHSHTRHMVHISDAHALSHAAANGLLKMLEEPVSPTLFLLHAYDEATLLETIKSRCFQITLPVYCQSNATMPMPSIRSGEITAEMHLCWRQLMRLKTSHTWDMSDADMLQCLLGWVSAWRTHRWPLDKNDHPFFIIQVDFLMSCLRDLQYMGVCHHNGTLLHVSRRQLYALLLGIKADLQHDVTLNIGMLHASLLSHLSDWQACVEACLGWHSFLEKKHD